MKRLIHNIRKKLASRRGESLGEVLVALLVSALAITMLAGAIAASSRMVLRSRDAMQDYYTFTNGLSAGEGTHEPGTIRFSENLVDGSDVPVTFYTNAQYDNVASYRKR